MVAPSISHQHPVTESLVKDASFLGKSCPQVPTRKRSLWRFQSPWRWLFSPPMSSVAPYSFPSGRWGVDLFLWRVRVQFSLIYSHKFFSFTEMVTPGWNLFLLHHPFHHWFWRFCTRRKSSIQGKSGKVRAVQFVYHGWTSPARHVFQSHAGRSSSEVSLVGD